MEMYKCSSANRDQNNPKNPMKTFCPRKLHTDPSSFGLYVDIVYYIGKYVVGFTTVVFLAHKIEDL